MDITAAAGYAVVLSKYTSMNYVGDNVIRTDVNHVERNGVVRVEKIEYVVYSANGEINKPIRGMTGQLVDIMI